MDSINLYRRNGKKVYIKQPTFEELAYTQKLWNDSNTMAEVGGVYKFPESKWDMFYKKMVYPTDGKNFYCHVYNTRDKFIGEVSFHGYDSSTKAARINIKISHRERREGYGLEALKLLLEYFFFEFSGGGIIDTTDIESGKRLLLKSGFESIGQFKEKETFKLTKERFLSYKPEESKNVVIIAYNNMSFLYHSIIEEIFNKANSVADQDRFKIITVSSATEVYTHNKGIGLSSNKLQVPIKADILVLPGGDGALEVIKDKEIIKFILTQYVNCDYLLSVEKSILILNRCRMLDGILIPYISDISELIKTSIPNAKFTNKVFVDYGKIMISKNLVGTIEACLMLVRKILGEENFKKLEKELGI